MVACLRLFLFVASSMLERSMYFVFGMTDSSQSRTSSDRGALTVRPPGALPALSGAHIGARGVAHAAELFTTMDRRKQNGKVRV